MKKYWQESSLVSKIQVILIICMGLYIFLSGKYYRSLIKNQQGKAIKKAIDSLALTERKKDTIWYQRRLYRQSVLKKSELIDKKLQQDEKAINNLDVTNERRQRFLSKHQK